MIVRGLALIAAAVALAVAAGRYRNAPLPAPAPRAVQARAAPAASPPNPSGAWSFGSGPSEVGRGTTPDGRPIAPSSFLADGSGVVVLDQENGRVVRSDGTSFPLPGARADDVARGADGSFALLDRLGAKEVAVVDAQGRLRGRLPLEGPGLEQARDVTRVVVSGSDVYVERNGGGPLLRIGTTDGKAAAMRTEIPGIPTPDGSALLSAGITSEEEGRAWVTVADAQGQGGVHRWTRELRFPGELSAVGFLDGGGNGAVWAVLLAGATRAEYTNWAVCLDVRTGRVRASVNLAVETPSWESFRDFAVRDDGSLVEARRGDQGVSFTAHDCPSVD